MSKEFEKYSSNKMKYLLSKSLLSIIMLLISQILHGQPTELFSFSVSGACSVSLNTSETEVWVANCSGSAIEKFNSSGTSLGVSISVAVNSVSVNANEELYALASDSVRIYDDNGVFIEIRGQNGADIEHDGNFYYIVNGDAIDKYASSGTHLGGASYFTNAVALNFNDVNYMFSVADNGANLIDIYDGGFGSLITSIPITNPNGVAILSDARVVITHNDSISFYQPTYMGSDIIGYYFAETSTMGGSLSSPTKMDVNSSDEIYLVNNDSEIMVIEPPAPITLPIKLAYFEAKMVEGNSILNWRSESEVNAEGYEVQYSRNGSDFDILGFVDAEGSGSDYQFIARPNTGINYYRLRQVDLDGLEEYSKMITVNLREDDNEQKVFPNPSNGTFTVSQPAIIYNLLGELIIKVSDREELNLPIGTYIVKFDSGEAEKLIVH